MPLATDTVVRSKVQFYAKVLVYLVLAVCLMFFDLKKQAFSPIKERISHGAYVVVETLSPSNEWVEQVGAYLLSKRTLTQENEAYKQDQLLKDAQLQRLASVERRVEELQALLGLHQRSASSLHAVTVITATDSPYEHTLKVRFAAAAPVDAGDYIIDAEGLVGQVLSVEGVIAVIRLISDQRASVHVQILRTGFRGVVFGRGVHGGLELKFVPEEADIKVGDVLVTSGLGGRHPFGIPVGTVGSIETGEMSNFARILLEPSANLNANEDFLVLTGSAVDDLFVPDKQE
ncbi:MAG: rod shape-determining protein MreC [Proteobacteria bacterium]|nr:rod shape-determining protein MreC [Pseudomonadota bacterium]MDA1331497.1 rod shape-determining protein MreC [Pseudomonadota bacterium]